MDVHSLFLIAIGVAVGFVVGRISAGSGSTSVMRPPGSDLGGVPPTITKGAGLTPDVETHIRSLVAANRKIEALKAYREATGVGLKEAKDAIDRM